ncbi:hypothetical protein [Alteromonas sp. ASW11-130]|uniref:hypothetical protein n=1 Tax=Alteromonas sp. ASW11-130 TaxID=3015775 RepID=UPI00224209D0|nr:hypothetical protein [Alteromonas sp. ASW11-130]MCW8090756.1 hypothetical protein [Alteromonas sp. ASW11-130]
MNGPDRSYPQKVDLLSYSIRGESHKQQIAVIARKGPTAIFTMLGFGIGALIYYIFGAEIRVAPSKINQVFFILNGNRG